MKRKILISLLLIIISVCYSNNIEKIVFPTNTEIRINQKNSEFYMDYYNNDIFFIFQTYTIDYYNEKIVMNISYILNENESRILKKLKDTKQVYIETASNVSQINDMYENSVLFFSNEEFIVKEFIRSVGNSWCTDDFGFIIKSKDGPYSYIYIKTNNIYSTYIDKGGYPNLWNKSKAMSYENQENVGIKFYLLFEDLVKNIRINKEAISIKGFVTDERVRFRKENNLHCETIRFFEKQEQLIILDSEEKRVQIGDDDFPWIKVKAKDGSVGYIYGKYIKIMLE